MCVFDQKVYMQHVPGHSASKTWWQRITVHGRGLQCTAEDYSARQRITVHGRGLQCTAEDYSAWQRITVQGRGLQCTAEDYSARQRITVHGRWPKLSYNGNTYNLVYTELKRPNLFQGTVDGLGDVIIKFPQAYSEDVHKFFADNGHAPTLYYCKRMSELRFVVVMEYVNGERLDEFLKKSATEDRRGLQCTAEDYSARQRITVHGRGLQCTAEDYSARH